MNTKGRMVKRSALLVVLMMVVAVVVPAMVASASDTSSEGDATLENEPSTAQQWKAELIAGYLAEDDSDFASAHALVLRLRTGEPAMGWGVLSRLALYSAAGMVIDEFLASARDADGGYSMGQLRKEYLEGKGAGLYDDLPHKNFGQMQKAEKPAKPNKADKKTNPGQAKKPHD